MPRESIYKRYKPEFIPQLDNNQGSYWFLFKSNKIMVKNNGNSIQIPFLKNLEDLNIEPERSQYLGTFDGFPAYTGELSPQSATPVEMNFLDLRSLYGAISEDLYLLAGRASQIAHWDRTHQFCGQCGSPTMTKGDEMAKICPECTILSYFALFDYYIPFYRTRKGEVYLTIPNTMNLEILGKVNSNLSCQYIS